MISKLPLKSLDEVKGCHFVNAVELAIIDSLNNWCSNEKIKTATFEELEDEDAAIAHIA